MLLNIVLVGAGEVGFNLSKFLSKENYNLTVIDIDPVKCNRVKNTIDARVIEGDGCSQRILQTIDFGNIDYFLALTKIDEINLVSSTIAKKMGAKNIIARLRNTEYIHSDALVSPENFGIDDVIYPEKSAQKEIENLVRDSSAVEVKSFFDDRIKLLGITLDHNSSLIDRTINNVYLSNPYIIHRTPLIYRNDNTFIPHGDTIYQKDDIIYFTCHEKSVEEIYKLTEKATFKVRNIMILGLGKISRMLAKTLGNDYNVKIVEIDKEKARKYSESLDESLVLVGDGLDEDFLESESIHEIDCYIATTENDKTNMLASLMAKYKGVKQVIMHVSTTNYFKSMRKIGIDAVVSKNISAVNDVFKIIHSKSEDINITPFEDMHIDALEIIANQNSKYFVKNYTVDDLPHNICLAGILRNDDIIIPSINKFTIEENDKLLIFLNPKSLSKIENLFK
jgi:trk system potassium uptake protein TrkA